MSSNSGAREAKKRPRNNIASSLHEKKKTEVCTKILKIEFEEVCSVFVLDLDFSCYLHGYVLGKLETSWQFLIG